MVPWRLRGRLWRCPCLKCWMQMEINLAKSAANFYGPRWTWPIRDTSWTSWTRTTNLMTTMTKRTRMMMMRKKMELHSTSSNSSPATELTHNLAKVHTRHRHTFIATVTWGYSCLFRYGLVLQVKLWFYSLHLALLEFSDRDDLIIKHVGSSGESLAHLAIALIQGHASGQAKSDQMDVADAFHKLLCHLYRHEGPYLPSFFGSLTPMHEKSNFCESNYLDHFFHLLTLARG